MIELQRIHDTHHLVGEVKARLLFPQVRVETPANENTLMRMQRKQERQKIEELLEKHTEEKKSKERRNKEWRELQFEKSKWLQIDQN